MGQVVTTRSINDLMAAEQKFAVEVTVALQRFAVKDWGDMDAEDKQTNEDALNYLMIYMLWVLTIPQKVEFGLLQIESPKHQETMRQQFVSRKKDKREL